MTWTAMCNQSGSGFRAGIADRRPSGNGASAWQDCAPTRWSQSEPQCLSCSSCPRPTTRCTLPARGVFGAGSPGMGESFEQAGCGRFRLVQSSRPPELLI